MAALPPCSQTNSEAVRSQTREIDACAKRTRPVFLVRSAQHFARRCDEAGASWPSKLVEPLLRVFEPLGVEALDRVGGAPDDRLGVVVRVEVGEDVVGERTAIAAL